MVTTENPATGPRSYLKRYSKRATWLRRKDHQGFSTVSGIGHQRERDERINCLTNVGYGKKKMWGVYNAKTGKLHSYVLS
jgi:hypothetical protein